MEADDLLGQLGRHVREDDAAAADADPIWERLARGELSDAEDAQLRERAKADPEVAALYEAYRPLGTDVRERLVQKAAAELSRPAPGRVLPWRRVAFAVAAPLAAAAALLLVLRHPAESTTSPLPAYALAFTGGDRATRSADVHDDAVIELRPGSHVEIVLRPATSVAGAVAVKAFLVQGGQARAWSVPMERSNDGAVRISGEAGALLGVPAGPWDLAFVLGRDGSLSVEPSDVVRAAQGEGGSHPWQLLERHVRLLDN